MQYLGYTYTKKLFIFYLKFKFNWVSYILFAKSNNPTYNIVFITQLSDKV